MGFFDNEEDDSNAQTDEFRDVAQAIVETAETSDIGLGSLQDVYNEYGFENSVSAKNSFIEASDAVRKKFGETEPFPYQDALEFAPVDFFDVKTEATDPEEAKLERIIKWEEENLKALDETTDLNYLQSRSQLARGIKQASAIQQREYYGKDNYIVTDMALRVGQGAIGPLADLAGADSVNDFFTKQTDPDRDDSYWSAIASGAGSAIGAVGAGLATAESGGWGTMAYLGASGAGAVRKQVEDSLENEGTLGEAAAAGGIEAVNQALQAGVGAKIFGGAAKAIAGKTVAQLGERIFPKVIGSAVLEGGTEALGQVVSNYAENIGQDKEDDLTRGVAQSGVAGFFLGGVAGGIEAKFGQGEQNVGSPEKAFKDYQKSGTEFLSEDQSVLNPEHVKRTNESLQNDVDYAKKSLEQSRSKLDNARSESSKEKWSKSVSSDEAELSKAEAALSDFTSEKSKDSRPVKSSTTGNIFSSKLSPDLRKATDYWSAGFGIKNLHVLTPEDIREGTYRGVIAPEDLSNLERFIEDDKPSGWSATNFNDEHFIVVTDPSDSYKAHHLMSHEIGHILTNREIVNSSIFNAGSNKLSSSLREEYARYKQELGDKASDVAQGLQGPLGNLTTSSKKVSELGPKSTEYLVGDKLGFKEFLANQVTEYALNPKKKPSTAAGGFFKKIGDQYRALWEKLTGKFKESPTLNKWLDEQFQSERASAILDQVEQQVQGGPGALTGDATETASLQNEIQSLEGSPPPAPESIPAGRLSVDLDVPTTPALELDNGYTVEVHDGVYYLKNSRDQKTLQPYPVMKYVKPEVAEKLRQLTNDKASAPDGTAVTLTTQAGELVAESDFVNSDLTVNKKKTGRSRTVVPTEETAEGNVPVLVAPTRTTDGVRQNPSTIAPGKVDKSLNAAKAGFGGQQLSEYLQKRIEKYGLATSEELGLAVESFELMPDGTKVSKTIPLSTYFPVSHAESGNVAQDFIHANGILGSMEHLKNLERTNRTDEDVATILTAKIQTAFLNAKASKKLNGSKNVFLLKDLLGEMEEINAHVGGISGAALGARTERAKGIVTGQAVGDLKVAQLMADLEEQGYAAYKKETGEELDLPALTAEAEAAGEVMKANEPPPPAKEGQAAKPYSPENQKKYDEAKARFDKAKAKIDKAESKVEEYISQFSPENQKTVKNLHDLLDTMQPGTMRVAVASKIFDLESDLIGRDTNPDAFSRIFNFYRGNLLSGWSTQERNFLGNLSSAASNVVGLAGAGEITEAGLYAKNWLKATPDSWREAKLILQGKKGGRFKFGEKVKDSDGNVKDLRRVVAIDNPIRLLKEGKTGDAAIAGVTFIQNAMFRLLNAQDAFFYRNAESAMTHLAEKLAVRNESDPVKRKERIENNVFNNKERKQEIVDKVNTQRATLKSAGIELSDAEVEEAIYEGMQQSFSKATQDIADRHGQKSIFTNDPQGVMGVFYDQIEKLADDPRLSVDIGGVNVKPFKLLMPFTRVAANVTSHLMEFTPLGIVKGLKNNPEGPPGPFNHAMTEGDAKMVMGRGIVGSMLMGTALSIAYAYKDEEKPYIEFYGYPPKGKWKAWKEQNIDSFSIRIGDNVYPLQGTSLAIIPAIVGGAMESIKSGGDATQAAKAAAVASLGAVSTMSFLKPAGELFEAIMGSKDEVNSESGSAAKKFSNFWKSEADTLASGFIPASGFFNNLGRWMNESPAETYNNLTAKVLGELPFAREMGIGQPQLNRFGEPITTSLQQRFFAGLSPHTIKTDPTFLWMQETGYDFPDQGPVLRLTTKADKKFAESQEAKTGYSDVLSEEQSRAVLEISGPEIKTFLQNLQKRPDFQVLTKSKQEYINENVNRIRARAKLKVLSGR